jgi:hypothetical protein
MPLATRKGWVSDVPSYGDKGKRPMTPLFMTAIPLFITSSRNNDIVNAACFHDDSIISAPKLEQRRNSRNKKKTGTSKQTKLILSMTPNVYDDALVLRKCIPIVSEPRHRPESRFNLPLDDAPDCCKKNNGPKSSTDRVWGLR